MRRHWSRLLIDVWNAEAGLLSLWWWTLRNLRQVVAAAASHEGVLSGLPHGAKWRQSEARWWKIILVRVAPAQVMGAGCCTHQARRHLAQAPVSTPLHLCSEGPASRDIAATLRPQAAVRRTPVTASWLLPDVRPFRPIFDALPHQIAHSQQEDWTSANGLRTNVRDSSSGRPICGLAAKGIGDFHVIGEPSRYDALADRPQAPPSPRPRRGSTKRFRRRPASHEGSRS